MAKKRRTKQQKIIAKLKRELAINKEQVVYSADNTAVQKTADVKPIEKKVVNQELKNGKSQIYTYDPNLIKKELIKTAALGFVFLGAIFFIQRVFHL